MNLLGPSKTEQSQCDVGESPQPVCVKQFGPDISHRQMKWRKFVWFPSLTAEQQKSTVHGELDEFTRVLGPPGKARTWKLGLLKTDLVPSLSLRSSPPHSKPGQLTRGSLLVVPFLKTS